MRLILTIFILMREGIPVYASPDRENVLAQIARKLQHLGIDIRDVEFVPDDSFFRVYEIKHPDLRELWHVRQVDAD